VQVGSESDPRQEPGNLPAPYVSPWLEFSRNLQALFADLQLRAQELWRRNGEGDLSVPRLLAAEPRFDFLACRSCIGGGFASGRSALVAERPSNPS
jgi:hypothetical protein